MSHRHLLLAPLRAQERRRFKQEVAKVGMEVYFGTPYGEWTEGVIVKINPKRLKIRTAEKRGGRGKRGTQHASGTHWNVYPQGVMPRDQFHDWQAELMDYSEAFGSGPLPFGLNPTSSDPRLPGHDPEWWAWSKGSDFIH